jgi:hypothetical protein
MALMCGAQTAATAPAPASQEPTPESLKNALSMIQQRITLQAESLEKIQKRMLDLDQSIEERVNRILQQLESVKDAEGTRVANLKEEVMKTLKKTIDVYQRERAKRMAELDRTYSTLSKEDMKQDVKNLQERTEKRVDQILALAATLTRADGFKEYEPYDDDAGFVNVETAESKQNRREGSKTDQATEDIVAGLRKSIDSLKQKNRGLQQELASARSPEDQQFFEEQIQLNEELINKRRAQVQSILSASGGESRAVSKQEAFQFEQLVDDMMLDLKRDFNELYRCATERDTARAKLRSLESQRSAIEADMGTAEAVPAQ